MKNQKIILAIIALIILGGGAFMLLKAKNNSSEQGKEQNQITQEAKKEAKKIMSLDPNKGIKCEQINDVGENNKLKTVIYFYKNKMRYDVGLAQETQGQKDFHMINDGEYSYMWGKGMLASALGGQEGGLKIKNDDPMNKDMQEDVDVDFEELKKQNYVMPGIKCEQWSPNDDLFQAPAGIEFKDMSNLMSDMTKNRELFNSSDPCAMCDMIPDAKTKEECKKSCQEDKEE